MLSFRAPVLTAIFLCLSACSSDDPTTDEPVICSDEKPCPAGTVCIKGKCYLIPDGDEKETDSETEKEFEPETEMPPDPSNWSWRDEATGLLWQNPPAYDPMNYQVAELFCENLIVTPYDNWRLPTIDELRTLVLGCDTLEYCGVTGICTDPDPCRNSACDGCAIEAGPNNGCYYMMELSQINGCASYFSSTKRAVMPLSLWTLTFNTGAILSSSATNSKLVRCIHEDE